MWIGSSKGIIGFDSLAILFDVLMSRNWEGHGCNAVDDRGLLKQNCPHDFVAAYANPWPSNTSRNWVSERVSVSGPFSLQYHVRISATVGTPCGPSAILGDGAEGGGPTGLLCERQCSILPLLDRDLRLVERRYSLSLRSKFGNYSIVVLEDPVAMNSNLPPLYAPYEDVFGGTKIRGFEYYDLDPTPTQCGIAQFQYLICRMTDSWYHDWSTTLSQIDDMITIKVCESGTE